MEIKTKNFCNFGFTLAEVLITLGIIGVIAALTMPNLINKYQKQETITRLKKAYSAISQALRMSEADNGPYTDWEVPQYTSNLDLTEYYEKYWFPYFKVLKVCKTPSECGYSSNNPFYNLNGSNTWNSFTVKNYRLPFITADGILYDISLYGGANVAADTTIIVDLNAAKGPNKNGRDVFYFSRTISGTIKPLGYDQTLDKISSECSGKSGGWFCVAKIINDGWQIKDDYPW